MTMIRSMFSGPCWFTFAAVMLFAAGCTTGPSSSQTPTPAPTPGDEAPKIPPAGTFVMDFSDFQDDANDQTARAIAKLNWGYAGINVLVWNTVITVTLAVPVGAFLESFNHEPALEGDEWVWAYDAILNGATYHAALHARGAGANIAWSMFISKEGEFEDVNWFSGLSNLLGTEGTWTLNRDPDNVTPFVGIAWHRAADGETGDIQYTNIVPDGPENGGYIFYAETAGEPHDRTYRIFDVGQNNLTEIEWNSTDKSGQVRDERHYGDEVWHCWDEFHEDVDCSTNGA